jgi:hypothetical protein
MIQIGLMEYRKDGIMAVSNSTFPLLHHSILPEAMELKKQLLYHTSFRI